MSKKPSQSVLAALYEKEETRKKNSKKTNKLFGRFIVMAAILSPLLISFLVAGSAISSGDGVSAGLWLLLGILTLMGFGHLCEEGYWK